MPQLRMMWTAVLVNQAIYILSKVLSDKKLALHELDNFERILRLLLFKGEASLESYQSDQIEAIMNQFSSEVLEQINDQELKDKISAWKGELQHLGHACKEYANG